MRTAYAIAPLPHAASGAAVTQHELKWLDFYRSSELHGGLVLGRLAQRVRDGALAIRLLRHAAEEVEHARLWAETTLALGGPLRPAPLTYQQGYVDVLGPPRTVVEVLALTQVFERRVYRHFTRHLHRPGTHPLVASTLHRMLEEERDHLTWVRRWLDAHADRAEVDRLLARYAATDETVYQRFLSLYAWRDIP